MIQARQIILKAIISTLGEGVLSHVVNLQKSHEVWILLEKMFASESKARIMQTYYHLAIMKKDSLSIANYF